MYLGEESVTKQNPKHKDRDLAGTQQGEKNL